MFCESCNFTTNDKSNFNRHCKSVKHIKNVSGTKRHICKICKYSTDKKCNFQKHMNNVHDENKIGKYECLACLTQVIDKQALKKHLRSPNHHMNVRKKYPETVIMKILTTKHRLDLSKLHIYIKCKDGSVYKPDLISPTKSNKTKNVTRTNSRKAPTIKRSEIVEYYKLSESEMEDIVDRMITLFEMKGHNPEDEGIYPDDPIEDRYISVFNLVQDEDGIDYLKENYDIILA